MTCYFRHIGHIFRAATVEVVPDDEEDIDTFIRELLRIQEGSCHEVWYVLRPWIENPNMKQILIQALRDEFGQR